MAWIRRSWTAAEADEWTKEDVIAICISPLAYITLMLGVALSLLLRWEGFLLLGVGIFLTVLLHWVIDPKLKAISEEYEQRQKEYLQQLEKTVRWEA
jgi:ABC-type transport system involved in cytochrome bd biosynthesis fused ATPase/permease subunit